MATPHEAVGLIRMLKREQRELPPLPTPRPGHHLLAGQTGGRGVRPGGERAVRIQRKNLAKTTMTTNPMDTIRVEGAVVDGRQLDARGHDEVAQQRGRQLDLRAAAPAVPLAVVARVVTPP